MQDHWPLGAAARYRRVSPIVDFDPVMKVLQRAGERMQRMQDKGFREVYRGAMRCAVAVDVALDEILHASQVAIFHVQAQLRREGVLGDEGIHVADHVRMPQHLQNKDLAFQVLAERDPFLHPQLSRGAVAN